jgi:hypothetical protein
MVWSPLEPQKLLVGPKKVKISTEKILSTLLYEMFPLCTRTLFHKSAHVQLAQKRKKRTKTKYKIVSSCNCVERGGAWNR